MAGAGPLLGGGGESGGSASEQARLSTEAHAQAAVAAEGDGTSSHDTLPAEEGCCGRIAGQAKADFVGYLKEYRCGKTAPEAEVTNFVGALERTVRAHDVVIFLKEGWCVRRLS